MDNMVDAAGRRVHALLKHAKRLAVVGHVDRAARSAAKPSTARRSNASSRS